MDTDSEDDCIIPDHMFNESPQQRKKPTSKTRFDDSFPKSTLHGFQCKISGFDAATANDGTYDHPPEFLPELPHIMPYEWHTTQRQLRAKAIAEARQRDYFHFVEQKVVGLTPQQSLDGLFFADESIKRRAQQLVNEGHKIVEFSEPIHVQTPDTWQLRVTTLPPRCPKLFVDVWEERRRSSWIHADRTDRAPSEARALGQHPL